MARLKIRFLLAATLALSSGGLFLAAAAPAAGAAAAPAAAGGTHCIAHVANYAKDIEYAPGCTGHDEPELDPVSSLPGSAKDLTWTAVLPKDGRFPSPTSARRSVGRHRHRPQPACSTRPSWSCSSTRTRSPALPARRRRDRGTSPTLHDLLPGLADQAGRPRQLQRGRRVQRHLRPPQPTPGHERR